MRPDIRLETHYRPQPMSDAGRDWLRANADQAGGQWRDDVLVVPVGRVNALLATASDAGLAITGWGHVTGDMLAFLREQGYQLALDQWAEALGFTPAEWLEMEAGTRVIPKQDALWDRAMVIMDGLAKDCG